MRELAYLARHPDSGVPTTFVPTRLVMGHTASAGVFCCLSAETALILAAQGIRCTIWLDDLCCGADDEATAVADFVKVQVLLAALGWEVNPAKSTSPSQHATYLGLQINTDTGTVSLDAARRAEFRALIKPLLASADRGKPVKTRDVQRVAGKLNWASRAVVGSKAFTVAIGTAGRRAMPTTRLSHWAVADLRWWSTAGCSEGMGTRAWMRGESIKFASFTSDASGTRNYGGHTANDFVYGQYSEAEMPLSVDYKELVATLRCLQHWTGIKRGDGAPPASPDFAPWRDMVVLIGTDSAVNCFRLNNGKAGPAEAAHVIPVLREVHACCHAARVQMIAVHCPRKLNTLSDRLAAAPSYRAAEATFRRRVWLDGVLSAAPEA